jgi:peptide chain release factor 3
MTAASEKEIARRRTFAIISHPDAGKTTLTEKLLLYGGAIHLAGSVKARRASRHAVSDWMEMEKERGISVTSSVLQFEYDGKRVNLLDTPGHQDFSEDTYRTLLAADSAVMLLDNRKGVEEQTRKLFRVCRMRRLPIFTFVNKCDRPGVEPLGLLDDVEEDLGLRCHPVTWPVTRRGETVGVYDRQVGKIRRFRRTGDHGESRADEELLELDGPEARELLGQEGVDELREEVELLELVAGDVTREEILAGQASPTFFGSALLNFGVEPFLAYFLEHAPPPQPRDAEEGGRVEPAGEDFSGFVFKIQANMDPNHRDRVAFVRICSGTFEPGLEVTNTRSGEGMRLSAARQFMAQERTHVERALPGDVVGLHDRGSLRVGDSLSEGGTVDFGRVPSFSPEHFARVRVEDPLRRKHLDKGLGQLAQEGAVQVFYPQKGTNPNPLIGVVGELQFDVVLHRLEHEYNVEARLDHLPYQRARWITGPEEAIRRLASGYGRALVTDVRDLPLVLFESEFAMRQAEGDARELTFHAVSPDASLEAGLEAAEGAAI